MGLSLAQHFGEQENQNRAAEPTAQEQVEQGITGCGKHGNKQNHNCII